MKDLEVDALVERLRLSSQSLVSDLYQLTKDQLLSEDRRESNLNTKGVALLTASGLSATVAFTFGAMLLNSFTFSSDPRIGFFIIVLYLLTLTAGLLSAILAVMSLLVRKSFRGIDENVVFNENELTAADADAQWNRSHPKRCDSTPDEGSTRYRRYLIAHLWLIHRNSFHNHESKAKLVWWGQLLYLVFLGLILSLGIAVALIFVAT